MLGVVIMIKYNKREIRLNGEYLGGGITREAIKYNGYVYKIVYEPFMVVCNEKEIEISSNCNDIKWVAPILDSNEDKTIIKMKEYDCNFLKTYIYKNEGCIIENINFYKIMNKDYMKGLIDFTEEEVREFARKNDFIESEFCNIDNWALDKETNKIVCIDYSR